MIKSNKLYFKHGKMMLSPNNVWNMSKNNYELTSKVSYTSYNQNVSNYRAKSL